MIDFFPPSTIHCDFIISARQFQSIPLIVLKRRGRCPFYFQACCGIFLPVYVHASTVFFCIFICKNWHIWWLNRHPFSLKGAATCFLMGFHAILRQILKYRFCAIPLREISVRAFFSLFTTRILLWLSYQEAYHHPLFSNWRMFFDIPNIFNKFWFFTYFDDVLHFAFYILNS